METKPCTRCHKVLPISSFYTKKRSSGKIDTYSECKQCRKEMDATYRLSAPEKVKSREQSYYQANKERMLAKQRERYYANVEENRKTSREKYEKNGHIRRAKERENSKLWRETFLNMYGRKCRCCGESTEEFLTLEHINGQKGIERNKKESGKWAYKTAIKEYRPDLFEVLCWNCNCSKGRYGYCPHERN